MDGKYPAVFIVVLFEQKGAIETRIKAILIDAPKNEFPNNLCL